MGKHRAKNNQKSNQEPKNMVASSYDEENSVFKLDTKFFGKTKDLTPVDVISKEMKDKKNPVIQTPKIPLINKYKPMYISRINIGSGFDRLLEMKKLPIVEAQNQKQKEGVIYPEFDEEGPNMILPEGIIELMKKYERGNFIVILDHSKLNSPSKLKTVTSISNEFQFTNYDDNK